MTEVFNQKSEVRYQRSGRKKKFEPQRREGRKEEGV